MKPKLRGVSHFIACFLALAAGAILIRFAPPGAPRMAAAIYSACLAVMFGISALYHLPTWSPTLRQFMRRLDHASIFLFLGASYTPFCVLVLPAGNPLLLLAWAGSVAGILQAVLWVSAPRIVTSAIYVVLGWMVIPYLPQFATVIGLGGVALLAAGGLCYSIGAVVYVRRRPDPMPTVFGYHEVFHALVILGCALQFIVVARLICGGGPLAV